jgi:hypothetical protein
MQLFNDANLQEPIENGTSFSFGVVPVGETEQKTIWMKNEAVAPKRTGYLKNLEFDVVCLDPTNDTVITDEKVVVLDAPEEMEAYAVAPILFEWTPAIDLEQGLKARLTIRAKKIVG